MTHAGILCTLHSTCHCLATRLHRLKSWLLVDCRHVLQFTVGPGSDSITVNEATSVSWRMLNTMYTTQPRLFKPLPLPHHTYIDFETSKAAPLALQVFNCADLKVGAGLGLVLLLFLAKFQPSGIFWHLLGVMWYSGARLTSAARLEG